MRRLPLALAAVVLLAACGATDDAAAVRSADDPSAPGGESDASAQVVEEIALEAESRRDARDCSVTERTLLVALEAYYATNGVDASTPSDWRAWDSPTADA